MKQKELDSWILLIVTILIAWNALLVYGIYGGDHGAHDKIKKVQKDIWNHSHDHDHKMKNHRHGMEDHRHDGIFGDIKNKR